jgi:hypothetical protein
MSALLKSCNFCVWNYSLCIMLLESKVKDDDKIICLKNTIMCLELVFLLFHGLKIDPKKVMTILFITYFWECF